MTKEQFLSISRKLRAHLKEKPEIVNLHIFRYSYFYDNSTLKHDCKYCRISYNLSLQANEVDLLRGKYEIKDF